jgi:O-antigen biosynthesis protein
MPVRGKSSPVQQTAAPPPLADVGRWGSRRQALGKRARRLIFWLYVRICPLPPLLRLVPPRNRQLLQDMRAIRRSGLFEADWYQRRYPDAVPVGMDPLEHFCRYGWRRGLDPSPQFATSLYLIRHPDAAACGNPLVHALRRRARGGDETAVEDDAAEAAQCAGRWYDEAAPELSIVILNFNKAALTAACLRSLWRHTDGRRYEILVVDNGSEPEDFARLAAVRGPFRLLRLRDNRFFGEGNNIGAERARAPVLCLMNNDVFVTPGWLPPLVRVLESRADCGLVGPRFLYPDGRVQEAGALLDAAGRARRLDHGAVPSPAGEDDIRQVDYVSAAAVLVRKAVFERVLGFDAAFEPVYYEDTDLCLKIAEAGLHTYCCLASAVVHHESATTSDSGHGLALGNVKEINRTKFVGRWAARLARSGQPAVASPAFAPARAVAAAARSPSATLALFAPGRLLPGGGIRWLLAFGEALRESHAVFLVTPECCSRVRMAALARDLGIDLAAEVLTLEEAARRPPFDMAVVLGEDCLPPVPAFARHNLFVCPVTAPPGAAEIARRWSWREGYERVAAASEEARLRITACTEALHLPPRPIDVLPPPIAPVGPPARRAEETPGIILHVGRFLGDQHCRGQDLLIDAFRELSSAGGVAAELHLAGVLPPEAEHRRFFLQCREQAGDLPVRFHLNATRGGLVDLYRRADCYWHAAGFGRSARPAGSRAESLGIALAEAMSAGCICFVPVGSVAAQVIRDSETGYVASSVEDLGRRTRAFLCEQPTPRRMAMRAKAAEQAASAVSFTGRLRGILQDLSARAPAE